MWYLYGMNSNESPATETPAQRLREFDRIIVEHEGVCPILAIREVALPDFSPGFHIWVGTESGTHMATYRSGQNVLVVD